MNLNSDKQRSPRNKTITLSEAERKLYQARLLYLHGVVEPTEIINRTIHQDLFGILDWLPTGFVDLLFADPPYNLDRDFNERSFSQMPLDEYEIWLDSWLAKIRRVLKPTASIYICGDWRSSAAIHRVYTTHRNR